MPNNTFEFESSISNRDDDLELRIRDLTVGIKEKTYPGYYFQYYMFHTR